MNFFKYFPKNSEGLYIIYELYSFDNFFRLLLRQGLDHESSFNFILNNCILSGYVWQERIYNKDFNNLVATDAVHPKDASVKAKLIFDISQCLKN